MRICALTLLFAAAAFGQYNADNSKRLQGMPLCTATRTTTCIPAVNGAGVLSVPATWGVQSPNYINGANSGVYSVMTLNQAITVTRIDVSLQSTSGGSLTGCSTSPVIRVTDGSNNVNITLANGASAWTQTSTQAYASGATLSITQPTAGSGCTGAGVTVAVVVQYHT